MVTADPFRSAKGRLARAKKHMNDLQREIDIFFAQRPHTTVIVETDPQTRRRTYKVRLIKELPDDVNHIVVEAVEAMRATLDQIGYAAGVLGGKINPKFTAFPFGKTATDVDSAIKGWCKDIPPEVSALFRTFKPYQGWNDALWGLNQLCNASKHKALVEIAPAVANRVDIIDSYVHGGWLPNSSAGIFVPNWDREKKEMKIGYADETAHFECNFNVPIYVQFGEIEPLTGVGVDGYLQDIATIVDGIITATTTEVRRSGLLK